MARAIRVKLHSDPAITISRAALGAEELVYIATANRKLRYQHGRSHIAYIGTTRRGVRRIASSAAWKAETLLRHHGLRDLEFYIVTCRAHSKTKAARKLERALLIRFRERFGELPLGNKAGKWCHWNDEADYFSFKKLDSISRNYEHSRDRGKFA